MVNQLKMADTQAILALHAKGWSARRIARELKVDRETVGRHIRLQHEADSKPANAPTGAAVLDQAADGSKPAIAPTGSESVLAGAESSLPAAATPAPAGPVQ
ncbi:MAG: helix-turn-helix domain-containing protein, partial [Phycisphaerae bacterium]